MGSMLKFNPMKHRIPLLKRAVPSMKKRLLRLATKDGFFLRSSHGAPFLLNIGNFVDRQIAFYDDFEEEQLDLFLKEMGEKGCDLFLDVGANIGFYSVLVAKSGLAGQVIAFEPDERNRLQLGANILLNRLVDRITVIGKAVSSSSGTVSFCPSPDGSTGQSKVGDGENAVTVEAVALDDIVTEEGLRIFIKMDIEGHELAALQGMRRLLSNNKVFLQVESFQDNLRQIETILTGMGLARRHRIGDDHWFSNF